MAVLLIGVLFGCFGRKIDGFRFLVYLVFFFSSTRDIHLFAPKGHLLWMDKILHHFEIMGSRCLLVFTGQSSFQVFFGWCEMDFVPLQYGSAAFRRSFGGAGRCPCGFLLPFRQVQVAFSSYTPKARFPSGGFGRGKHGHVFFHLTELNMCCFPLLALKGIDHYLKYIFSRGLNQMEV